MDTNVADPEIITKNLPIKIRVTTTVSSTATKDPRLSPRMSNESNDTISLMSLSSHQSLHLDNNQTITNPVPNIENGKIDPRKN